MYNIVDNKYIDFSYKNISLNTLLSNCLIIFLYIIISRTVNYSNIISGITLIIQIVSLLFIVFYILKNYKINKVALSVIYVFILSLGISFIRGSGDFHSYIAFVYPVLAYSYLLSYFSKSIKLFRKFISIISKYYIVLASLNLILMIISPNLFGDYYLLGGENLLGYTLLVGLLYNGLAFSFNKNRMQFILYAVIHIANVLILWSGGTLMGLFIIFSSLYLPFINRIFNKFSLCFFFCIYLVFFVIIVFFNATGILEGTIVERIVIDFFGKNMTFSGRTFIWYEAFLSIIERPLLGYGIQDTVNLFSLYNSRTGITTYFSAHNQLLQTLYEGGILAVCIIIIGLILLSKKIAHCDSSFLTNLIKSVILSLFFMYMTEAPSLHYFWEIFVLSYSSIRCLELKNIKA